MLLRRQQELSVESATHDTGRTGGGGLGGGGRRRLHRRATPSKPSTVVCRRP